MADIRAADARVDKLFRARCLIAGCDWAGGDYDNYQDANAERLGHLAMHRHAAFAIQEGS